MASTEQEQPGTVPHGLDEDLHAASAAHGQVAREMCLEELRSPALDDSAGLGDDRVLDRSAADRSDDGPVGLDEHLAAHLLR